MIQDGLDTGELPIISGMQTELEWLSLREVVTGVLFVWDSRDMCLQDPLGPKCYASETGVSPE